MKTYKKVLRRLDARHADYAATISRIPEPKRRSAYRKPGSRNPRKHGA